LSEIISEEEITYVSALDAKTDNLTTLVDPIETAFGVSIQCRLLNDAKSKQLENQMALGYQTSQSVFHIVRFGQGWVTFDGNNRKRCMIRLILANADKAGTSACDGYTRGLVVQTIVCLSPKV
jgi:hypothetical protein